MDSWPISVSIKPNKISGTRFSTLVLNEIWTKRLQNCWALSLSRARNWHVAQAGILQEPSLTQLIWWGCNISCNCGFFILFYNPWAQDTFPTAWCQLSDAGDGWWVPGSTTAATLAGRTQSVTICLCTRDLSRFPMSGQASPAGERGTWGQKYMTV